MIIQKKIDYISYLILLLPVAIVVGPLISDLIITIMALFICVSNYKKVIEYFDHYIILKIILIFYVLNSINSLFAQDVYISLKSSFLYIRFPLFVIASVYLLKKYPKLILYLYYSILVTIFVVSLDAIIQFFNGENILGFVTNSRNRISGFFLDENILGSYLARITPFLVSILIFLKKDLNNKIFLAVIIVSFFGVIISGERTSLLLITLYWLIFVIFILKSSVQIKLFIITILITVVVASSFLSDNLRERYIDLSFYEFKEIIEETTKPEEEQDYGGQRLKHIIVSLEMFNDAPLFGFGNKMFATICFDQYYFDDGRCSTHPHMIIMQILVENGIAGILVYSIFFLILVVKFMMSIKSNNDHISSILLLILINFCPLLPSGSLYNNQVSIFLYFPFIIYFFYNGNNEKILYEKKD